MKHLKSDNVNRTVFVGLSGGVDSSVAAYLLKKEGYKVVGAFIKTWQPEFIDCTWKDERRDAMRVAAHLEIPFVTIDLEKEYKEGVADYMIREYKAGRTPNPDVMCNKEVKFGAFLNRALSMGADFVATGHYAQIARPSKGRPWTKMLRAVDNSKEQSYFLWTLTEKQLEKIIFPIGGLKKSEVRKIAQKAGLPTAEKKDSQGICMLGDISMKDFLSHYIPKKKGNVLNVSGEVIGTHDGALFFTVGERHGFTITKKTSEEERLYVISKEAKKNTIVVGTYDDLQKEIEKSSKDIALENFHWINSEPEEGKTHNAQIRYHQDFQKVTLEKTKQGFIAHFKNPQTAASGQSAVFYDDDVCLGGGIIK